MMISITEHKSPKNKFLISTASLVFWLVVWELVSIWIGEELFLASPFRVLEKLWKMLQDGNFYKTIGTSFWKISSGFLIAMILGTILSAIAFKITIIQEILKPMMAAVKAAPVASFVVLALLAVGSKSLSVLISFLMVVPIFYSNILEALKSVDKERFEAAAVFGMLWTDRFRFIYLPYVKPFFISSCVIGIGTAWKAGVSAEVIGIVNNTIGGKIYDAKIQLETAELLAYTFVVIAISLCFEKLAVMLINYLDKKLTD